MVVHDARNGSCATSTYVRTGRSVVLVSVMCVVACGGRSRSEHETTSSGGTGGATGGTAGSIVVGSGAATTGGAPTYSVCSRWISDYVASPKGECEGLDFVCLPGSAVFVDDCGCGCESTPFHERKGTLWTDAIADACNGPSGPLTLFESSPEQLILGENAVYVRVERVRGTVVDGWAVDKRTGAVSLAPPWEELMNAPGVVVSGPLRLEVNGVSYSQSSNGMLVAEVGDERRSLFRLPGYEPAFIVVGTELYSSSYDGGLHHGYVDPVVPPALVEQRGVLDDDDPYPVIVAADEDAIYWTAGPFSDAQVTDGDPSMLYRTCR
jgi:hypothetical protein